MDMTGERRIPAPRQVVWEALNDPEVLKLSIPGCESLEKLADDQMKATAAVKVGPISARFSGKVQLTDIDPPNGYRISGEGQGGVAGFAKGGANVALADDGADTLLSYQVNAQVGGKLAQLGGRLIDATAKQMADAFFDRFSKQVQALSPVTEPAAAEAAVAAPAATGPAVTGPAVTGPAVGSAAPVGYAAGHAVAEPVAVGRAPVPPPSAISVWSLIPSEPFGLPIAAWVGGAVFVIMVLLMLGSML
ncbi:MAG TPA: carbon monoxide dehydrogenase subunit G [Rhodopila sp.]